jgi:hypothetical protein
MPKKLRITVNGQEVDAVEVSFSIIHEDWNEYELADGGRVRAKLGVQRIMRVLDESGKPAMTNEGDPFVVIQSQNQVVASE